MTGTVGQRVWRGLTAALAVLLLLLAPAGRAHAASTEGKAAAQAAVAHDAVVVAPTTRAAAARTGSLSTDATPAHVDSLTKPPGAYRTEAPHGHEAQPGDHAAPARAPPLKD